MSECKHELAEQDTYIADGYCPLCLLDQIQRLQARVDELESALRGYVKATTGQESAIVTFPMALEGEVK